MFTIIIYDDFKINCKKMRSYYTITNLMYASKNVENLLLNYYVSMADFETFPIDHHLGFIKIDENSLHTIHRKIYTSVFKNHMNPLNKITIDDYWIHNTVIAFTNFSINYGRDLTESQIEFSIIPNEK